MSVQKLIYRKSPKFIKVLLLRRLLNRLDNIEDMLVPKRMIPYQNFLKSLYDFSLALPVGLCKNFKYFTRTSISIAFKSSQQLSEALETIINYKEIHNVTNYETAKQSTKSFNDFYSNEDSIKQILYSAPVLIFMMYILRGDVKDLKEGNLKRDVIDKFLPEHLHLLQGRIANQLALSYIAVLRIIIESNLEDLRGKQTN